MRNPEDRGGPRSAVDFSTPFMAAGITDPAALQYKQQIETRLRARPAPKGPPIPLLTGEAQEGRTMADQARPARAPGSIIEPTPSPQSPPRGFLPQDLLPEEAVKDPLYREGGGSRYAASQPALALKYGVIRNGQRIAPQQLVSGKGGLSPATVEGLRAVEELNRARASVESPDAHVEREAAASSAGAAARLGAPPKEEKPLTVEERKEVEKEIRGLDDFDYNRFREAVTEDVLNNDEQRKIIESRLTPLSLDDAIVNDCVTQIVPIVVGKFEPEFQSLRAEDDLALKRLIMQEGKSVEVNARYLLDKFSLMTVAAGTRALNRNPLPDYRDQHGNFDEALFWKKFHMVVRRPFHMLAAIGVQYYWFEIRVRRLFVAERLGNG